MAPLRTKPELGAAIWRFISLNDVIARAGRRLAASCLLLVAMAFAALPVAAAATPRAPSGRFAAIAVDARTGQVLYARNADAARYPASLTKVMTLYLAFDALESGRLHLGDRISISPHAAAQAPVKLGLPAGRSLSVREALDVIVVKSANDVAVALAEHLAGSETAFVRRMNRKAKHLGMRNTHFANASGLPDPRNVSTARDLARLAKALIRKHPEQYDLFDKEEAAFRGRTIAGHNRLLRRRGVDGIKTGYTRASGFNLMTSGVRSGRRVIAVVLGGRTARSRDVFMAELLETSFRGAGAKTFKTARLERDRKPVATTPRSSSEDQDDDRGASWIQVGTFRNPDEGAARLTELSSRHPRRLGGAEQRLARAGDMYNARFVAPSRTQARALCRALIDEGEECVWSTEAGS